MTAATDQSVDGLRRWRAVVLHADVADYSKLMADDPAATVDTARLPRTRRAWFRVGLDAGEIVTAADGRYFGDPLNIAARIQAIAQAGGINVTEAVYRALDEPAPRLVALAGGGSRTSPSRCGSTASRGLARPTAGHSRRGRSSRSSPCWAPRTATTPPTGGGPAPCAPSWWRRSARYPGWA